MKKVSKSKLKEVAKKAAKKKAAKKKKGSGIMNENQRSQLEKLGYL